MARDPRLDPDKRYPSDGPTALEERARPLLSWRVGLIVARTRDAIELRFPDPRDEDWELSVLFTPEAIELRLPKVEWTEGSHAPLLTSRLWRRVGWPAGQRMDLWSWMDKLAVEFERSLEECSHCKKKFLPKRMVESACHGCASSKLGIVF